MADSKEIEETRARLLDARKFLRIDSLLQELDGYEQEMSSPTFWDDAQNAQKVSKATADIRATVDDFDAVSTRLDDAVAAYELSQEDESFSNEYNLAISDLYKMLDTLEVACLFSGQFDSGDAIVSINPGQGGLEAQDWTEMLYRMYKHYSEDKGWQVSDLDIVPGEGIGLDKAVFQVSGRNAYGMLSSESGVHRLVRISPTDAKKRRHTTFAAVEVLPVLPDDIEIQLDMNDVRVDVYRSSGPGGQCVNTTDSAVRLTHVPTGIVVTCQNEKSQLQNKEAALRVLKAKLFEIEERKRQEEIEGLRGDVMENSFGSQVRNYVLYPYQLVKDLRSGFETGNVDSVLNGDIDDLVLSYHKCKASNC